MFLIIFELTIVDEDTSLVEELAISIVFTVFEFAFVDISVCIVECALTRSFAISPLALISGAIFVNLRTVAMFHLNVTRLELLDVSSIGSTIRLFEVINIRQGIFLVLKFETNG